MTRFAQIAVVLLAVCFGASGCVLRARPVLPVVNVGVHPHAHGHVHVKGCGHPPRSVIVVR